MTCTEDRGGAIIDMDTTMRDLGDVRRSATELMSETTPTIKQSIDYLLGIDTTERWSDSITWTPSPEDWGNICVHTIGKMDPPSLQAIAALVMGALTSEVDELRHSCATQLRDLNPSLGAAVLYLQTLDSNSCVSENALETLCDQAPGNDWSLAELACARMLEHESDTIRKLAVLCRQKVANRTAEP